VIDREEKRRQSFPRACGSGDQDVVSRANLRPAQRLGLGRLGEALGKPLGYKRIEADGHVYLFSHARLYDGEQLGVACALVMLAPPILPAAYSNLIAPSDGSAVYFQALGYGPAALVCSPDCGVQPDCRSGKRFARGREQLGAGVRVRRVRRALL